MKRKPLSESQRLFWYAASLGSGLTLTFVVLLSGQFDDDTSRRFALTVFPLAWLMVVFVLRRVSRDLQEPMSLRGLLRTRRKRA